MDLGERVVGRMRWKEGGAGLTYEIGVAFVIVGAWAVRRDYLALTV